MAQKPKASSEETGYIKGAVHLRLSTRSFSGPAFQRKRSEMGLEKVLIKLNGPSIEEKRYITKQDGEFCFDQLPINETYTLTFPMELSPAEDASLEYRLAPGHYQNWPNQPKGNSETGEVQVMAPLSGVGDCPPETDQGGDIVIVYEVSPDALILDVVEDFRAMRTAMDDLVNFPPPTAMAAGAPGLAAGSFPDGASLQTVIRNAFSKVLGVPPGDFAAMQRALPQRFEPKEIGGGRTVYAWKPGALVVETLLGAVKLTGDQARLYQRARQCLEDSQSLLDKIIPLSPDADQDLVRAQKAVVRDLITQVATESGREQEPRAVLVEKLLFSLLDRPTQVLQEDGTPREVRGELGALEQALCYDRAEIIDLDDEEQRTLGLMLRDNVQALQAAWNAYLNPLPGERLTMGAHLRTLSGSLAMVAESTRQARTMLDSVYFGSSEQRTLRFKYPSNSHELSIDDLLSMVEQFATVDAPKLIQEGKLPGARAILDLAEPFYQLVREASELSQHPFKRRRVGIALKEVATGLAAVKESALALAKGQAPATTID